MYIELKNLPSKQRATFKPDPEQEWEDFIEELQARIQQIGIPVGSFDHLTGLNNGPELAKMFITYELPAHTLRVEVVNPVKGGQ
jgi:hypothetical protein